MFAVETGIQMPGKNNVTRGRGRPRIYPFNGMDIGDSFFYPCDTDTKPIALDAAVKKVNKETGKIFSYHRSREGKGYRVWRVA